MSNLKRNMKEVNPIKKLFQFFLQGLVVISPIGITIYAVVWLFNTVDNLLPDIIHNFFPNWMEVGPEGAVKKIPGLGFIIVILVVMFIGWISSTFFVSRLVDVFNKVLEKTPGISFIYSSIKDFLEAFAGDKKKFDKPVLVNVDGEGIWRMGFITQTDADSFELINYVVVYLPHSYAISGITYLVPKEKIRPLKHTSPAEAMKFTVSGGVSMAE